MVASSDRMNLVRATASAGAIPANRPIDHARRIGTALAMGSVIGTIAAVLFLDVDVTNGRAWIAMIVMIAIVAACLVPWMIRPAAESHPVPVVARTLGTKEDPRQRYVKRGSRSGLLVPVIVRTVDAAADFRSIVMMTEVDPDDPKDPPVGTLMALEQTEPGMGELVNTQEVTDEQAKLVDRLRKHPRELANEAPVLPMRRGTLERNPWWAALEFWAPIPVGFAVTAFLMQLITG